MLHAPTAMFGLPGGGEMIVVLGVALLIFGSQLPKVARWAGKSIKQFRSGMTDIVDEVMAPPQQKAEQEPDEPKRST